jgi:hypothetical protein
MPGNLAAPAFLAERPDVRDERRGGAAQLRHEAVGVIEVALPEAHQLPRREAGFRWRSVCASCSSPDAVSRSRPLDALRAFT